VSSKNQQPLVPMQDERFDPPAVPPAFAAPCRLAGASLAHSWPR
jgi:hypothetical protein